MNILKVFSLIALALISIPLIGCSTPAAGGGPTLPPTAAQATPTALVGPTFIPTPTPSPTAGLPQGVTVASVTPVIPPSQEANTSGGGGAAASTAVVGPGTTSEPGGGPLPVPSTPHGVPPATLTVTMAYNGKTITLQVGQEFTLYLDMGQMMWTVTIDHQDVVSRVMNIMPINGSQGVFRANKPGQANLSALGRFVCPTAAPCVVPNLAMGFRLQIVVQ